jgi:hypothetical protein
MILPGWPGDRRAEKEEIRAVAVGEHRADLGNPRARRRKNPTDGSISHLVVVVSGLDDEVDRFRFLMRDRTSALHFGLVEIPVG